MITRPLLASPLEDIDSIKYPVYCSAKYDGIRCLIIDGKAVSRNFKPQPNIFIRETLEKVCVSGLDGELVLKDPTPVLGCDLEETNGVVHVNFNDIQSKVMSFEGEPDFEFHVFDYVKDSLEKPYLDRLEDLRFWYDSLSREIKNRVKLVLPVVITNKEELLNYETKCLEAGFEGIMLRKNLKYKCGRSTNKEGILLKLKRFVDSEAEIIGFEERLHNANEQEEDAFGLAKRASCKANLIPAGTLGTLLVRDIKTGIEFGIGTGFDDALRKELWNNKSKYLGKLIKYKSQPVGTKEKPRFPVFLGFRPREDLD